MLEKGRLYSLRKDGTKDSLYLNIKNKRFLFGSSEHCTVRIYVDGIFPEHCVLSIGGQGKAYLEPLHPSALTLVNGIKIKHKVCLEDNDMVTILIKEFQFVYPPNSLSSKVSLERLILPYSKQMKTAQKFKILNLGNNWDPFHPFRKSNVLNINYIPKKQTCIITSNLFKKIPEYLLKFTHQELVNILCVKLIAQEVDLCSDKSLIKDMNKYVKERESPEERRNLALRLYEFISFLKGLLNRNEEYLCDLLLILESVWKYSIARADKDILFLPLKSLNLKGEITSLKKSLQSRILSCISGNSLLVSNTISENENHCLENPEVSVSSNCKMDGQKQNQLSSRKISISYKKRVSLAVKRYHLRKRKSIMAKTVEIGTVENLELSGERPQMKARCTEIKSYEHDVVLNLEKQQITRTKRKRGYNKKEKEELQNEGNLKIEQEIITEVVKDHIGKLNTTAEQLKEKRRNKKASAKKTHLNIEPGKENIAELTDNSPGNQISITILREQKQSKGKQNSKNKVLKDETETKHIHDSPMKQNNNSESKKGKYKKKKEVSLEKTDSCKSTQECDIQESSCCQRITRSMAKKRH